MRTMVGVLRGGQSSEYDASLKTGSAMLEALDRNIYDPRDIFIDKAGEWHHSGVLASPERALRGVDVALLALHGHFGEDGKVQQLLERMAVPYSGSDAFGSAVGFNKHLSRQAAKRLGLKIAHAVLLEHDDEEELAQELFRTFPHPAVVKPVVGGSMHGVSVAGSYLELVDALKQGFAHAPQVLVEEYIKGKDATVGVIEHFRGEPAYALIPEGELLTPGEKTQLTELAKQVHQGLGLRHYSASDFVVSKRGIYFLEVNTLPKLHSESRFSAALRAVGSSLSHFLDHIIKLAQKR